MACPEDEMLSDILNHILAVAEECLEGCDRPIPDDVFHHHGPRRPPGDCCSHLTVHVRQIRPTSDGEGGQTQFPGTFIGIPNNCGQVQMAVDASLTLSRDCFPTLKDDKSDPFPTAAEMQAASDELAIDARVLWCCLLAAQAAGTLLPPGPQFADLVDVVWGTMSPFRGGGCAGWEWEFTLNLPSCCWSPPPSPASGS